MTRCWTMTGTAAAPTSLPWMTVTWTTRTTSRWGRNRGSIPSSGERRRVAIRSSMIQQSMESTYPGAPSMVAGAAAAARTAIDLPCTKFGDTQQHESPPGRLFFFSILRCCLDTFAASMALGWVRMRRCSLSCFLRGRVGPCLFLYRAGYVHVRASWASVFAS